MRFIHFPLPHNPSNTNNTNEIILSHIQGQQHQQQQQQQQDQPRPPFSVATYNLWNINGPWRLRLQTIARILTVLKPDVILLQEIRMVNDAGTWRNQLDILASMMPAPYSEAGHRVYEKVMDMKEEEGREEGLGILSAIPIKVRSVGCWEIVECGEINGIRISRARGRACVCVVCVLYVLCEVENHIRYILTSSLTPVSAIANATCSTEQG